MKSGFLFENFRIICCLWLRKLVHYILAPLVFFSILFIFFPCDTTAQEISLEQQDRGTTNTLELQTSYEEKSLEKVMHNKYWVGTSESGPEATRINKYWKTKNGFILVCESVWDRYLVCIDNALQEKWSIQLFSVDTAISRHPITLFSMHPLRDSVYRFYGASGPEDMGIALYYYADVNIESGKLLQINDGFYWNDSTLATKPSMLGKFDMHHLNSSKQSIVCSNSRGVRVFAVDSSFNTIWESRLDTNMTLYKNGQVDTSYSYSMIGSSIVQSSIVVVGGFKDNSVNMDRKPSLLNIYVLNLQGTLQSKTSIPLEYKGRMLSPQSLTPFDSNSCMLMSVLSAGANAAIHLVRIYNNGTMDKEQVYEFPGFWGSVSGVVDGTIFINGVNGLSKQRDYYIIGIKNFTSTPTAQISNVRIPYPTFACSSVMVLDPSTFLLRCDDTTATLAIVKYSNAVSSVEKSEVEKLNNQIHAYPIPTTSTLTVENNGNSTEVIITDALGKIRARSNIIQGTNQIDVSNLESGTYNLSYLNQRGLKQVQFSIVR